MIIYNVSTASEVVEGTPAPEGKMARYSRNHPHFLRNLLLDVAISLLLGVGLFQYYENARQESSGVHSDRLGAGRGRLNEVPPGKRQRPDGTSVRPARCLPIETTRAMLGRLDVARRDRSGRHRLLCRYDSRPHDGGDTEQDARNAGASGNISFAIGVMGWPVLARDSVSH